MQECYKTNVTRKIHPYFYLQHTNAQPSHTKEKKTKPKLPPNKRISCHHLAPKGYLTQQEYRCVQYAVKRFTVAQTAKKLALSPRTVEFYINNIKKRFSIKKKKQLIELFMPLFEGN